MLRVLHTQQAAGNSVLTVVKLSDEIACITPKLGVLNVCFLSGVGL